MKHKFTIEGLDCPFCASKLATSMANLKGVNNVKINFLSEKLTIDSELEADVLLPMLQKTARAFDPDVKVK